MFIKKENLFKIQRTMAATIIKMYVVLSSDKQTVRLGDIFAYNVGTVCSNANTQGEFSKGKKWEEW